jgi:hypothetical protein
MTSQGPYSSNPSIRSSPIIIKEHKQHFQPNSQHFPQNFNFSQPLPQFHNPSSHQLSKLSNLSHLNNIPSSITSPNQQISTGLHFPTTLLPFLTTKHTQPTNDPIPQTANQLNNTEMSIDPSPSRHNSPFYPLHNSSPGQQLLLSASSSSSSTTATTTRRSSISVNGQAQIHASVQAPMLNRIATTPLNMKKNKTKTEKNSQNNPQLNPVPNPIPFNPPTQPMTDSVPNPGDEAGPKTLRRSLRQAIALDTLQHEQELADEQISQKSTQQPPREKPVAIPRQFFKKKTNSSLPTENTPQDVPHKNTQPRANTNNDNTQSNKPSQGNGNAHNNNPTIHRGNNQNNTQTHPPNGGDDGGGDGGNGGSGDNPAHNPPPDAVFCTCTRSGCLKLYCRCFQLGLPCGPHCVCLGCLNCEGHEQRKSAMDNYLAKNPNSFFRADMINPSFKPSSLLSKPDTIPSNPTTDTQTAIPTPKPDQQPTPIPTTTTTTTTTATAIPHTHSTGPSCNCNKSHCIKMYCLCRQHGRACNESCLCKGCKNGKPGKAPKNGVKKPRAVVPKQQVTTTSLPTREMPRRARGLAEDLGDDFGTSTQPLTRTRRQLIALESVQDANMTGTQGTGQDANVGGNNAGGISQNNQQNNPHQNTYPQLLPTRPAVISNLRSPSLDHITNQLAQFSQPSPTNNQQNNFPQPLSIFTPNIPRQSHHHPPHPQPPYISPKHVIPNNMPTHSNLHHGVNNQQQPQPQQPPQNSHATPNPSDLMQNNQHNSLSFVTPDLGQMLGVGQPFSQLFQTPPNSLNQTRNIPLNQALLSQPKKVTIPPLPTLQHPARPGSIDVSNKNSTGQPTQNRRHSITNNSVMGNMNGSGGNNGELSGNMNGLPDAHNQILSSVAKKPVQHNNNNNPHNNNPNHRGPPNVLNYTSLTPTIPYNNSSTNPSESIQIDMNNSDSHHAALGKTTPPLPLPLQHSNLNANGGNGLGPGSNVVAGQPTASSNETYQSGTNRNSYNGSIHGSVQGSLLDFGMKNGIKDDIKIDIKNDEKIDSKNNFDRNPIHISPHIPRPQLLSPPQYQFNKNTSRPVTPSFPSFNPQSPTNYQSSQSGVPNSSANIFNPFSTPAPRHIPLQSHNQNNLNTQQRPSSTALSINNGLGPSNFQSNNIVGFPGANQIGQKLQNQNQNQQSFKEKENSNQIGNTTILHQTQSNNTSLTPNQVVATTSTPSMFYDTDNQNGSDINPNLNFGKNFQNNHQNNQQNSQQNMINNFQNNTIQDGSQNGPNMTQQSPNPVLSTKSIAPLGPPPLQYPNNQHQSNLRTSLQGNQQNLNNFTPQNPAVLNNLNPLGLNKPPIFNQNYQHSVGMGGLGMRPSSTSSVAPVSQQPTHPIDHFDKQNSNNNLQNNQINSLQNTQNNFDQLFEPNSQNVPFQFDPNIIHQPPILAKRPLLSSNPNSAQFDTHSQFNYSSVTDQTRPNEKKFPKSFLLPASASNISPILPTNIMKNPAFGSNTHHAINPSQLLAPSSTVGINNPVVGSYLGLGNTGVNLQAPRPSRPFSTAQFESPTPHHRIGAVNNSIEKPQQPTPVIQHHNPYPRERLDDGFDVGVGNSNMNHQIVDFGQNRLVLEHPLFDMISDTSTLDDGSGSGNTGGNGAGVGGDDNRRLNSHLANTRPFQHGEDNDLSDTYEQLYNRDVKRQRTL